MAMVTSSILRKLEGGDRRWIGRSNEVVSEVFVDSTQFGELFRGLFVEDPVVRARAADAVEKISVVHPEFLPPYRSDLIGPLAECDLKEVRWHVPQMLSRVRWRTRDSNGWLRSFRATCATPAAS